MAIEGDIYGIVSDLQRRAEQYRRPARVLSSGRSDNDDLRLGLAVERGRRNEVELELRKLKAENARLVTALGNLQLRVLPQSTTEVPTIHQVQEAFIIALAAENYAVDGAPFTAAYLSTPNRHHRYSRPRQISMWLCRKLTQQSLPIIGRYHGNRDHTTCMHAIQQVQNGKAFSSPMLHRAADRVLIQFGAAAHGAPAQ